MIHGTILGTLGCWSLTAEDFSAEDQQLLEMLATQIASAIAAAASREDSERLARVDTLTGLHNRLQLSEDEAAIVRSVEVQPMMVAMIDIDFFKRFNDEYGHLVGDRVLREVAASLRRVLRSTDRLYRFGGEEFLLLAPCDDERAARALAERVRRSAETHPIETRAGELARKVTVSVGVALLSNNDDALSAAIERADQALYEAKGNGRNRVSFWDGDQEERLAAA
jgi:diguanylate cyclase (GGDEF)-like protein